ncbi:hypothetical protein GCM10020001_036400 [Nonomuraea salmonea]
MLVFLIELPLRFRVDLQRVNLHLDAILDVVVRKNILETRLSHWREASMLEVAGLCTRGLA